MLELFSGTGSIGKELKKQSKNAEIVSLDIHPKYNPTYTTNILHWDYKSLYTPGYFDIIWASPPCTEYSRAKTTGGRDLESADKIVKRTLSIIRYLRPKHWFLENPGGGGMLDKRSFMIPYQKYKNRCTYCHYGTLFKKPTNIWTNLKGLNLRHCSGDDICPYKRKHNKHAQTAQISEWSRYSKSNGVPGSRNAENVYPIPPKLVKHILSYIKF